MHVFSIVSTENKQCTHLLKEVKSKMEGKSPHIRDGTPRDYNGIPYSSGVLWVRPSTCYSDEDGRLFSSQGAPSLPYFAVACRRPGTRTAATYRDVRSVVWEDEAPVARRQQSTHLPVVDTLVSSTPFPRSTELVVRGGGGLWTAG